MKKVGKSSAVKWVVFRGECEPFLSVFGAADLVTLPYGFGSYNTGSKREMTDTHSGQSVVCGCKSISI